MPSNHLILCHHLLLPSVFPNLRHRGTSSELSRVAGLPYSHSAPSVSVVKLCLTFCCPVVCSRPGFPQHTNLPCLSLILEFDQTHVLWKSNHLILCLTLLLLPSIFPSIRVFSNVSSSHQVAKVLSFRFSISPSSELSGLISFRSDWFDLLAVQGTLKSLLQHHSSKASVLWPSVFFMVQFSHPYMNLGGTQLSPQHYL